MNVKSVEKENGKAKVVVEIDKPEFEQALNKAYAKCRKDIMLPGFRKGKAPRKMVESMYGATVFYEDAVNEIFPEIYTTAIVDQQLKAVGSPSVSNMDTPDEGGVVLTIETELYPEVTLGQYKGIEVPKREVKVEESEVDAEVNRMAERNARIETVDRAAQMGDTVVIDFEGFEGGKPFQGGKAEDYSLTLGSGSFIPGFEEALVGAVEFAKDVSEFDTLDALKNDIRERFTKSREEQNERAFESSAVQLAAANMTCNVPACMIDEQVDHQIEQFAYQLQSQGMKMEDYTKMIGGDLSSLRQSMRPMAEQTVRSDILLSEIARAENLEVTDEEVEEELKKLAEQYQMELDKVKAAVDTAAVKSDLMGKKAAKIITDNAVAVAPTEEKKDDAETSEKE